MHYISLSESTYGVRGGTSSSSVGILEFSACEIGREIVYVAMTSGGDFPTSHLARELRYFHSYSYSHMIICHLLK